MFAEKPWTVRASLTLILLSTQVAYRSNFDLAKSFLPDELLQINPVNFTVVLVNPQQMAEVESLLTGCLPWLSSENKHSINEVSLPMKIEFRQSGGYAGLVMGSEINTDLLDAEEATKLQSLVEQSDILQVQPRSTPNSADLLNYEITIETKEGTHQVSFNDMSLPESAIPLLEYLQDRAKPIPR